MEQSSSIATVTYYYKKLNNATFLKRLNASLKWAEEKRIKVMRGWQSPVGEPWTCLIPAIPIQRGSAPGVGSAFSFLHFKSTLKICQLPSLGTIWYVYKFSQYLNNFLWHITILLVSFKSHKSKNINPIHCNQSLDWLLVSNSCLVNTIEKIW